MGHISPMALYRLVCALGPQRPGPVLTRCGLPWPPYVRADEQHRHGLTDRVYRPTIVCGRVIWPLGSTEHQRAGALTQAYGAFHHAASQPEPSYRVHGVLTDGFDSTTKRLRTLRPAPCGQQAPRETDGDRVFRPHGLALPVAHPVVPGTTAQRLARVCARPTVAPRCGAHLCHDWSGQRGPCAALDAREESRLVCGVRRSADAGDEPPTGSSPPCYRPDIVHDARLPSPQRESAGVSSRAGTPVQPGPLSASGPACQPMWCGSRRRESPHTRLVPQPPNPHLRRLTVSG